MANAADFVKSIPEGMVQGLHQLGRGQRLDLAYAVGIMNSRQVHGNQTSAYDGTYDFAAQLVALTYTMDF